MNATLYCGDSLTVLRSLPDGMVRCCVTSPPYWGLRDYGVAGQLGLEATPDAYVASMVALFAEVRRVLADDGTCWINLGDSYASSPSGGDGRQSSGLQGGTDTQNHFRKATAGKVVPLGLKPKDLVGIPWRTAFALQADGWYLRSDIIWSKPNPMPESVTDRPTKAHEYVFLLSKRAKYYYDAGAIREALADSQIGRVRDDAVGGTHREGIRHSAGGRYKKPDGWATHEGGHGSFHRNGREKGEPDARDAPPDRNARSVWSIATQPYPEAHFATFPEELARRCILAGSAPSDTVLDPFGGSGTVAQVATGNGRKAIHIDLNPAYIELARMRIGPMLCVG